MNHSRITVCCTAVLFFTLSLAEYCFSGQNWIIIGKRDDNSTYQYDKNSIKKISPNIYEVYDGEATYKSKSVRQIRIDCKKKKYAIGKSDGWAYDKKVMSMDFSKNGWVWFDADGWVVDLIDIVCPDVAQPK